MRFVMDVQLYSLIVVLLLGNGLTEVVVNSTIKGQCPNVKTSLVSVRKRRHLAFPPGSSASVTTSIVKTFMTHVPSGWYTVVEAEVVYMLPDEKFVSANLRRKLHHRQKKEIWETLQSVFEQRNMNGPACIMRTICDAQMRLAPKGMSLVHDVLRAMFTAPLHESEFVNEVESSYGELLEPGVCEKAHECPFSVVDFILDLNKHK